MVYKYRIRTDSERRKTLNEVFRVGRNWPLYKGEHGDVEEIRLLPQHAANSS